MNIHAMQVRNWVLDKSKPTSPVLKVIPRLLEEIRLLWACFIHNA